LNDRQLQFEWDEIKAAANARKHGVSFELASTVFNDPRLLTVADLENSEIEERWFSIGCAQVTAQCFQSLTSGRSLILQRRKSALSRLAKRRRLRFTIMRKVYE
jgi:uncharacterized DUF497 family protein